MRKWMLLVFTLCIFLFSLTKVKAFTGPYAYDVNSVSVQYATINGTSIPSIMSISGWAVVSSNKEMHNIQPTYTLTIIGVDNNGTEVINTSNNAEDATFISNDLSSKYSYDASNDNPVDLTLAYFDGGVYSSLGKTSDRSDYKICDRYDNNKKKLISNTNPCNYMYINVNFQFDIYLSKIKDKVVNKIKKDVTIYMYLNVSTKGGTVKVYGNYIQTKAYTTPSKSITIGIQEGRVNNAQYLADLGNYGVRFGNTIKNITLIATRAKARCIPGNAKTIKFSDRAIWKANGSACNEVNSNLLLLNNGNAGETYKVIMDSSDPDGGMFDSASFPKLSVFMYHVKVTTNNGYDGGKLNTYIPAAWTRPETMATYLYITSSGPVPPTETIGSDAPDTRNLTCNSNLQTTFDYGIPKVIYSNGLCSITCGEVLKADFEQAKQVKAGMGFDYPAHFTGSRTCRFNYDGVNDWINNMNEAVINAKDLITQINKIKAIPASDRTQTEAALLVVDQNLYNAWLNQMDALNGQNTYCSANSSNWININKYDINANIHAKAGSADENVAYIKIDSNTTANLSNQSRGSYNAMKCVGDCSTTTNMTISTYNWTETATLDATYGFANYYYVEKYSGKATTTPVGGIDYYDIGRKYLTNLNDPAGRYNFDVVLDKVGRNGLNNWDKKWNINVDCYYDVTNQDFPPNKEVGFMFRQISLISPFPKRAAGANWQGSEHLITDKGESIYRSDPSYLVALTPINMLDIRAYNTNNSYGDYDLDAAGRSRFIHFGNFANLFIRK